MNPQLAYAFRSENLYSSVPQSPFEVLVLKELLNYLPEHKIKSNCQVLGFEMDFFIPSLRLNIEVDGKYHRGKKLARDKRRDAFLRSSGVEVLRINVTEQGMNDWPPKEIKEFLEAKLQASIAA